MIIVYYQPARCKFELLSLQVKAPFLRALSLVAAFLVDCPQIELLQELCPVEDIFGARDQHVL
jgi:hypothetical protein